MTRYVLDTNVISELRKQKPHGAVLAWMSGLVFEQIFVSAVTFGELQTGIELTRRQDTTKAAEIEAWVDGISAKLQVLMMDAACFREWARLMQGRPAQLGADALIAATARVHDLIVATRDEADFKHFDVRVFNPFKFPRT